MVKLYHAIKGNFFAEDKPRHEYVLVAEIDESQLSVEEDMGIEGILQAVYTETQNISLGWMEASGAITKKYQEQARSTSVGDVIEYDDKFYRCENMGWKEIDFK